MASVALMGTLIYRGAVVISRMNQSLELKVAELRESEERTRLLLESSVEGFIGVSIQEEITFVNRAACGMLGYATDELVGRSLDGVIHSCHEEGSTYLPENYPVYDSISRGITCEVDNAILWRKDGTSFPVDLSSNAIHKEGQIAGFVITFNDITERKRLEADRTEMERKLLHVQKLESLNAMAKGIAHDFNNLLMAIMGNLELALTDRGLGAVGKNAIENAIQATDRSAELSHQMLIYSGKSFYVPKNLDLNEFVNKLAHNERDMLKSVDPQVATLHLEINKDIPLIRGDENQIQRVVTNLVINGAEALGDNSGHVTIKTGQMYCDEAYLSQSRLQEKPSPGLFVFLEVTDTGCGMDAETQRQLFDPFFTTKFWGRGLGMAEVNGIVKSHHGAIMVDSEPGKGTTIRTLFPAAKKPQANPVQSTATMETTKPPPDEVNGRKTILVIEDEEPVRGMLLMRLNNLGYNTIAAADGEEGVSVFSAHSNEIDLVLLDFLMPRMNGVEAFEKLINIKPDVKVILSSGYTEDDVWKSFLGKRPAGFLNKPYKAEAVKDELDRLLGTPG
jgi:PAS domain S-box-containing protein